MLATLLRQPKAVYLLAFVQLWNRFSHYGMRALLLLYMVKVLHFEDGRAIGIFAVYNALVELGGVFGAYLAKKFLGLRRAVMLGGWLIGTGHLLLAFESNFLLALSFVILGSCLYTTNVATFLGDFYAPEDPKREQGFTLFYMSINIGAFIATLLCGYIAETFGWHLGFGLAAIGMVFANLSLTFFRSHLCSKGQPPQEASPLKLIPLLAVALGVGLVALYLPQIACPLLPWIGLILLGVIFFRMFVKKQLSRKLPVALGGMILFFAAAEQLSSSLLLYADRMGHPSAMSLLSINPLVIIIGGTLAHALLGRIQNPAFRLFLPFAITAAAFSLIFAGFSSLWMIGGVIGLVSFAEILIGPATYSQCSEAATLHQDPQVMALMPIGFSMAASLGGLYSQSLAGAAFDPHRYQTGYGILALLLLGLGGLIAAHARIWRSFWKKRNIEG